MAVAKLYPQVSKYMHSAITTARSLFALSNGATVDVQFIWLSVALLLGYGRSTTHLEHRILAQHLTVVCRGRAVNTSSQVFGPKQSEMAVNTLSQVFGPKQSVTAVNTSSQVFGPKQSETALQTLVTVPNFKLHENPIEFLELHARGSSDGRTAFLVTVLQ
jgi:hypothetical protein